jgi:hypothetical protein
MKKRARSKMPIRGQAICGTEAGYTRHRRENEPVCEPCRAACSAAKLSRYYANHETRKAQARQRYAQNKDKERKRKLLSKWGLTSEQWEEIFNFQDRRCACCGTATAGAKKGWMVDHNHATKAIRGIICTRCNTTLGMLGDDAGSVVEACLEFLSYLMRSGDVVSHRFILDRLTSVAVN